MVRIDCILDERFDAAGNRQYKVVDEVSWETTDTLNEYQAQGGWAGKCSTYVSGDQSGI